MRKPKLSVRKVNEGDRQQLEQWVKDEVYHKDLWSPELVEAIASSSSDLVPVKPTTVVVEDENGVIAYLHLVPCLRIYTQMIPEQYPQFRKATYVAGIPPVIEFMKSLAKRLGYKELIFSAGSKKLVAFLQRLGFYSSDHQEQQIHKIENHYV